jgi:methylated-DNA-[protein]-cysteine S-methyltransferase
MRHHEIFKAPVGWMGVAASPRGVCEIILPQPSRSHVEKKLAQASANGHAKGTHPEADLLAVRALVARAKGQLVEYFEGRRRDLDVPLDLDCGSPFQRRVWRAIARIPHGRVRSYKWVAMRLGGLGYARAVGNALGANPVPIAVPCHRVIAHDASLGGFTGGVRAKKRLLLLEGTLPQLKSH